MGITSKIKLFEIEKLPDGTRRFQSQLPFLNKSNTADFIMDPDGVMKNYTKGCYKPYTESYTIVSSKNEMINQKL